MARKHDPGHERYQPVDAAFMRSVPFAVGNPAPDAESSTLEEKPEPSPLVEAVPPEPAPVPQLTAAEEQDEDSAEPQATKPGPERLTKPLRFLLPRTERSDVMRIVNRLGDQLETSVEWSHIGRALVLLLRHSEMEILKHARRSERLVRPRNDDALALAEFEHQIAQILWKALRGTPPLR